MLIVNQYWEASSPYESFFFVSHLFPCISLHFPSDPPSLTTISFHHTGLRLERQADPKPYQKAKINFDRSRILSVKAERDSGEGFWGEQGTEAGLGFCRAQVRWCLNTLIDHLLRNTVCPVALRVLLHVLYTTLT